MNGVILSKAVVVFDLDDTLYPEADYVDSGVRHVCAQIKALYGLDLYHILSTALANDGATDWLAMACELAGLRSAVKESLLWMYRLHSPDIRISASCHSVLRRIQSSAGAIAILTDGRSITQRLKLDALGLSDLPVYISEDYDSNKPAPDRFMLIQEHFRAEHYIYVADNVEKDFVGCNALGWVGIGMRGNGRNVHPQVLDGRPRASLPFCWVNSWDELASLLLGN